MDKDIRKSDSKGRITVGKKGVNYYASTYADGSIVLTPVPEERAKAWRGMRIFNQPMGSGKTTELVTIMLAPGNEDVIYVAPTMSQANAANRIAREIITKAMEAVGERFSGTDVGKLTARFTSASGLSRYPEGTRYVIDELDGVISGLVNGQVLAVSGTDAKMKADQIDQLLNSHGSRHGNF